MKFSALYHDSASQVYFLVDAAASAGHDGIKMLQGPTLHFALGDALNDNLTKHSFYLGVDNLKKLVSMLSDLTLMTLSRGVRVFEYELPFLEIHDTGERDTLSIAISKDVATPESANLAKLVFKRHSITIVERGGGLGKLTYTITVTHDMIDDLKWLVRYYEPSFI